MFNEFFDHWFSFSSTVGAVSHRAFFLSCREKRAVRDRAYSFLFLAAAPAAIHGYVQVCKEVTVFGIKCPVGLILHDAI